MKIKQPLFGALAVGILAGILRAVQYLSATDAEGYYKNTPFAAFSGGALIGLLAVGFLWSVYCGWKQKEQVSFAALFPAKSILLILMGTLSAGDGIFRLLTRTATLDRATAVLCLAGAAGWLLLGLLGEKNPAPVAILPIGQFAMVIIAYFWNTYKYIQVSEYTLVTLGLCAVGFLTMLIMKAAAGADCTRGRLVTTACTVLTFGFAAFLASPAGGITAEKLFYAGYGILAILIAVRALRLPVARPEPAEVPDLSSLNEYINNIPEVEDNENENP